MSKAPRKIDLIRHKPNSFSNQHRKITKFLQHNHTSLNLRKKDWTGFDFLEQEVKNNQVFFTAEVHGVAVNEKLEFKFLQYFKQKAGVKYYLLELPYSTASLLNRYLETGNEKILQKIISAAEGTYAGTKNNYYYWKKVYQFNKSLPQGEKLKLIGVDIEHQLETSVWYLYSLLPDKKPSAAIEPLIKSLKIMYKKEFYHNNQRVKKFITRLQKDLQTNHKDYRNFLGDKMFAFKLVSENILTRFKAYSERKKFNKIRDKQMYENFKRIYPRLMPGKLYGQWGLNHVYQKNQGGVDWIASLMNGADSPVAGEIVSIVYFYQNCKQMRKRKPTPGPLTTYNSLINLDQFAITDLTLFKLAGEDSPFNKKLYWINEPAEGVTTDYFQYAVLIKNSKATAAFKQ